MLAKIKINLAIARPKTQLASVRDRPFGWKDRATLLIIALALSAPMTASATQISRSTRVAVALLRTSIACPMPVESWIGKLQSGAIWHKNVATTSKYLGTESRFREFVQIKSIIPDSPDARIAVGMKIIDFNYKDIASVQQQGRSISFSCKNGERCIRETFSAGSNGLKQELESDTILSCDRASAEDIKKAADVLTDRGRKPPKASQDMIKL
jgi:hypothetical protein